MLLRELLHKGRAWLVSIATILVAIALPLVYTAASASADSWCNSSGANEYCLQTNGGHVYACSQPNPNNGNCYSFADEFDLQSDGLGDGLDQLLSDGSGGCIGDYGNSSSNASTGLDSCPASGGNAGWGTKFYVGNCSNGIGSGYTYVNYHWNAWLGPQSYSNNATEYLNKPSGYCFADLP
jgi:hypothetical protein